MVQRLAEAHGLYAAVISDEPEEDTLASRSDWVLLSESESALEVQQIAEAAEQSEPRNDWRLWSDDFNNIVQVLK